MKLRVFFCVLLASGGISGEMILSPDVETAEEVVETPDLHSTYTQLKNDTIEYLEILQSRVASCVANLFPTDPEISAKDLKIECTGLFNQMIFQSYREHLSRLKRVFLDVVRLNLRPLREEYEDELLFFMTMLNMILEKDYSLRTTLSLLPERAYFHVNPKKLTILLKVIEPQVKDFEDVLLEVRKIRLDALAEVPTRVQERDSYIKTLDRLDN